MGATTVPHDRMLCEGRKPCTCILEMSQMVQVVSIEHVAMIFGSCSFQSKEVSGAQNSVFLFWRDGGEAQ